MQPLKQRLTNQKMMFGSELKIIEPKLLSNF
jgi:hypothetical protein